MKSTTNVNVSNEIVAKQFKQIALEEIIKLGIRTN